MGMTGKLLIGGSIYRGNITYPRCEIFSCVRAHSGTVSNRCCHFCEKKDKCNNPCQNHPDKCGKCVRPTRKKKEGDRP